MNAPHGGVAEREDAKALKAFVREDVQVQVLPPLPLAPGQAGVYDALGAALEAARAAHVIGTGLAAR